MAVYTIKRMIREFGEDETKNKINLFKNRDESILYALRNKIIESDKKGITTTYFILDDLNNYTILAFFTLQPKDVEFNIPDDDIYENKIENRHLYKHEKFKWAVNSNNMYITGYYISLLAKDSSVNRKDLHAEDILNIAIKIIYDTSNASIVTIDAHKSNPKICKIYEKYNNGIFRKVPSNLEDEMNHYFMKIKRE